MVPRYQGSGNAGGEKTGCGARDERSQRDLSATAVGIPVWKRGNIFSNDEEKHLSLT